MHTSDNLGLTIVDNGDPADLETVSDDFEVIDAFAGDIATVESSPTVAAHSVGEFLLYEGRLYKVTAAISAGTALTLGTNVRAANIGSEIKTLQDSVYPSLTTSDTVVCYKMDGEKPMVILPCLKAPTSVSVSSAAIYNIGNWTSLSYSRYSWCGNLLFVFFDTTSAISNDNQRLARMDLVVA